MATNNNICTDGKPPPPSESQSDPPVDPAVDPTSWMKTLSADATLAKLIVFGTHSSCDLTTQKLSIMEQLNCGARFVDLRLTLVDGEVCILEQPAVMLKEVLRNIRMFVTANKTEKVIVYLRSSDPNIWPVVKDSFTDKVKPYLILKTDSAKPLSEMEGSIVIIAPNALDMEENWGEDTIEHLAPQNAITKDDLHAFLQTTAEKLKVKKDKLVWVEVRSLAEGDIVRTDMELGEVINYFSVATKNFNIITFSLINDRTHFDHMIGVI